MLRGNEDPRNHNRLDEIKRSALDLRLNLRTWPEKADPATGGQKLAMAHKAMCPAIETFQNFEDVRQAGVANKSLSPSGVIEKMAEFASQAIPTLESKLAELTKETIEAEEKDRLAIIGEAIGRHVSAPTEPNDIAIEREIRDHLRSLPKSQRTAEVLRQVQNGDTTILSAVLNAPNFLTGVDEEFILQLRDEAAKKLLPGKFEQLDTYFDASLVARRALDGVIRWMGHETRTLAKFRPPPAPSVAA